MLLMLHDTGKSGKSGKSGNIVRLRAPELQRASPALQNSGLENPGTGQSGLRRPRQQDKAGPHCILGNVWR